MPTSSTIKYGTATVILIVALYLGIKRNSVEDELHQTVLESLRRAENKVHPRQVKVAVGFGACLDIFVDALALMNNLGIKPPNDVHHHQTIGNLKELAEAFGYFFRYGAAAERYFSNQTLFKDIVKASRALDSFRTAPGGNAPVMANRLASAGAEVMLGAQSNEEFMKKLWPGITSIGPETENMDVHLIMEYKTGEKWGKYVSQRANRYVIHSDQFNPKLGSLEPFIEPYISFKPNLLVVSGLQMMDNYPFEEGERRSRLSSLQDLLKNPAGNTKPLIHFELASFVDNSLMSDLLTYVAPHVDSFGMNEQEIANLESALKYGNITIISNPYPRVAAILDQMRNSYKLLREEHGRVSRIHVHTLAFQAIMTEKRSKWKNTMSASARASLTANRHVCGTKFVDVGKSKLLMDDSFSTTLDRSSYRISFHPEKPVSCWEEGYKFSDGKEHRVLICVAPNLVCTKVFQTVGGGDNISAAGLSVQI